MTTQWKDVPGYEGRYQANDVGEVRSLRGISMYMLKHFYIRGYPAVTLSKRNQKRKWYVHRIVGETFLGPLPKGMHTDHIDRDPRNNTVSNLRYTTAGDNVRNAKVRQGMTSKYKGVCARRDKWGAFIAEDGKQRFLGHFDTELAAARAYDSACVDGRTTNFGGNAI